MATRATSYLAEPKWWAMIHADLSHSAGQILAESQQDTPLSVSSPESLDSMGKDTISWQSRPGFLRGPAGSAANDSLFALVSSLAFGYAE